MEKQKFLDGALLKTLNHFKGSTVEVRFFSPFLHPVEGKLTKYKARMDERGLIRVKEIGIRIPFHIIDYGGGDVREIPTKKYLYPVEEIKYIRILGEDTIDVEPEKTVITQKSISSFKIIRKCIENKTPCSFFLFERELIRGFIKLHTPTTFVLLDLNKKDLIILFKHSIKFWVPLAVARVRLKNEGITLSDKTLPLSYRKTITRRIPRREWQFKKEIKGKKLRKMIGKYVKAILREGTTVEGIMKSLTWWDFVIGNRVYPVVVFRHSLLEMIDISKQVKELEKVKKEIAKKLREF